VHPSAVRRVLHIGDANEQDENHGASRAIEYERYRDEPDADTGVNDDNDDTSMRAEINNLNRQSNLASVVEGGRLHPSALVNDSNKWRD